MERGLIKLNINVAGRMYPVMVQADEEPSVRKIEREVNRKISDYQMKYSNQDKQDCISMALLTLAFDQQKINVEDDIYASLNNLESLLDTALSS